MRPHPQNPYESYTIEASAGAGKTYQLTRRFLNIVSAGASPANILTITFTVKAATEMKERIIHEASTLLYNTKRQAEFDQTMGAFHREFAKTQAHPVPVPRSAQETAQAILSATQLLRVTTIDALFYDWFAKFPWEANPFPESTDMRSLPYEMMDGLEIEDVNKKAWDHVFANASQSALEHCLTLLDLDEDQGILGLEHKVFELFRNFTFLWQSEQETGQSMVRYPVPKSFSEEEFFQEVEEDLRLIMAQLKSKDIFLNALTKRTIAALTEERFFNQDGEVSGLFVRGKTREQLFEPIQCVNNALQLWIRIQKLTTLNQASASFFEIYKLWLAERETIKRQRGLVEFHDLAIGNYKLFHDPSNLGATWLIQRSFQHLMIDECQDTSFLQWSVFRRLVEEILANAEDALPSTVFLVGDQKQSIYGFREADPKVLEHMNALFANFEKTCIPLHESYRSAPLILDYVNKVFQECLEGDFPTHATARNEEGTLIVPDCGRIVVQELVAKESNKEDAVADEAKFLANYLKRALSGEIPHPVYDKKTKSFRPLQASDCVLLYRSSTHVELFEKALRDEKITYLREERKGFFERQEIQDCLALLHFLADFSNTVALLTFLRSPLAGISDRALLAALAETQGKKRRELAVLDCFRDFPVWPQVRSLILASQTESPSRVLFRAYEIFSAQTAYANESLDGEIAQKNLCKLYELILRLEQENHRTLGAVLGQIALQAERNEEASASAQGQAVRLMTIHKAKGLEFPFVALIKTSESWFRVDRYWAKVNEEDQRGLAFIGTLKNRPKKDPVLDAILSNTEKNLHDESKRLLYVALTRASQYLLITAHHNRAIGESFYPLLLDHAPASSICELPQMQTQERSPAKASNLIYSRSERLLPDQITIVNPHTSSGWIAPPGDAGQTEKTRELSDRQPGFVQRFLGIVIHAALARLSQNLSMDLITIWEAETMKFLGHERQLLIGSTHLHEQVQREIIQVTSSQHWRDLLHDAKTIHPELRIVQLRKNKLMLGSCDLCVEKHSGDMIVVEWKTMKPVGTDLMQFSVQSGFTRQLDQYLRAIRDLRPQAQVTGWLWFTKSDGPLVFADTTSSQASPKPQTSRSERVLPPENSRHQT